MSAFPTRRDFLAHSSHGFGAMALWHLLSQEGRAATTPTSLAPRAKNVIFLFMMGGQSHLDLTIRSPRWPR